MGDNLKKRLLNYLCCPECESEFKLISMEEEADEVINGSLYCSRCKKKYPIVAGIPVILDNKQLKDFYKTKKNWENWWKKIREKGDIELYDELWRKAEKNLGGEPLYKKEHFVGKVVLDAGCGNGRYIASDFSKYECKEIIAVDIGRQVFEAKKNNDAKNTHFVQADLTRLPFRKNAFDVITSHGVLHHTPNPKKAFIKLSEHLKAGGMMAIYVYHKEWAHFKAHKKSLFLDAAYAFGVMVWQGIRKLVSRMPHFLIKSFAYLMAVKATFENALEKNKLLMPLGKIAKLIPPFAYMGVNFHERVVRNYDHYSATYNYFQTIEEVEDWFKSAGFNQLEITSVPVSMRGIKQKITAAAATQKTATTAATAKDPLIIKKYELIDHFKFRKEWERLYEKMVRTKSNTK
jgi:2-polyprenyl-3-methyl-5-hydroxy-6-metoxy-1,4-benzoquinol methylase